MSQPPAGALTATPIGLAPGVAREAAGQDAAKYGSSNPVVKKLLDRWTAILRREIGEVHGTVIDVGSGEGLCLDRLLLAGATSAGRPLPDDVRLAGVEYRADKASVAGRLPRLDMTIGDAGMLPFPDRSADLVLCTEVLEHLPTVAPAVAELARITAGRCVVSVPWEPWFRLGNLGRGKNIGRFGNDPEHVQWFNRSRLRRTLAPYFGEVRVVSAFPWLVAVARP